mgnify:CR=1 FL=1
MGFFKKIVLYDQEVIKKRNKLRDQKNKSKMEHHKKKYD